MSGITADEVGTLPPELRGGPASFPHAVKWDEAVWGLAQSLRPTPADAAQREALLTQLRAQCQDVFGPSVSLEAYGSYASGMFLPDSDMDLALVGHADWAGGRQLQDLTKVQREKLMRTMANHLEGSRTSTGRVQRVLGARVPVLNFRHWPSMLECDITIGRADTTFKARFIRALAAADERFVALYRLVKLWARAHSLNDPVDSTFNSWTLSLLVVFYLQEGVELEAVLSQTRAGLQRFLANKSNGEATNRAGLAQLLAGFFQFYAAPMRAWAAGCNQGWRVCPWYGRWRHAPWAKAYLVGVEDPFSDEDNTARTVGANGASPGSLPYIVHAFEAADRAVQGACDAGTAFAWLFGPGGLVRVLPARGGELGMAQCQQLLSWLPAEVARAQGPYNAVLRRTLFRKLLAALGGVAVEWAELPLCPQEAKMLAKRFAPQPQHNPQHNQEQQQQQQQRGNRAQRRQQQPKRGEQTAAAKAGEHRSMGRAGTQPAVEELPSTSPCAQGQDLEQKAQPPPPRWQRNRQRSKPKQSPPEQNAVQRQQHVGSQARELQPQQPRLLPPGAPQPCSPPRLHPQALQPSHQRQQPLPPPTGGKPQQVLLTMCAQQHLPPSHLSQPHHPAGQQHQANTIPLNLYHQRGRVPPDMQQGQGGPNADAASATLSLGSMALT